MYFLLNSFSLTNKILEVHFISTSEKKGGKNGLFPAIILKVPQNMEKNILRKNIYNKEAILQYKSKSLEKIEFPQ